MLSSKVDEQIRLNKHEQAFSSAKKLFSMSTSFAVILLLTNSEHLFNQQLFFALTAWERYLALEQSF